MATILIFTLAGFIQGISDSTRLYFHSTVDTAFMGIIYSLPSLVLGLIIALALPEQTRPHTQVWMLEALGDNPTTQGVAVLGSGSIDGSMKYVFYYQSPEADRYKMGVVGYDSASIKYTEETPHVEVITQEPTDHIINWFALDIRDTKYVFHIPQGSILNNFTLDTK